MDGARLVKEKPEVLALIDVVTLAVELDVRSTYLYGRYTKEARDLPQTRWPCRSCKGRGCERCEGTGLRYAHSVQDLIGGPLIETMGGADHAFHGMGREDIDVRCLGRGRPFVIEIKEPERRTVDLASAMERINEHADGRIAITDLQTFNALGGGAHQGHPGREILHRPVHPPPSHRPGARDLTSADRHP